jgi:hypothetical protein
MRKRARADHFSKKTAAPAERFRDAHFQTYIAGQIEDVIDLPHTSGNSRRPPFDHCREGDNNLRP